MKKEIKINNKYIKTSIIFKKNYINNFISKLLRSDKNIFCVVDINVKYIFKSFEKNKNLNLIFLKSGESIKNFKNYNNLCEILLEKNIDRNSVLIGIGGGTIGDLCGFVASTVLRGIEFKLIPTTLLSQVDSSIGGKNGINSKSGKNMIGTFYNPNEVIIDTNILKSLPIREIRSGYAEIIKHALIKDYEFFKWLEKNYNKIFKFNLDIIEKAVFKSIMIKIWYVKKDPKEQLTNSNSRAILNYGHTVGHSLEAYYGYNKKLIHGEAISIGMVIESIISNKMGFLKDEKLKIILEHFKNTKLKINDKNIKKNKIFHIMQKDKKNSNNNINIILLRDIGKSFYFRNIEINLIKNIIKNI